MRIRLVALFASLAVPAGNAYAQFVGGAPAGFGGLNVSTTASSNAAQGETPGIRVSDTFLLHTALALGAGVDSNVFYSDQNPISSAVTHVMPQLALTNTGRGVNPDVQLQLTLNGDYRQYYGSMVTDDEKSAFGVGAGAILDIMANSPWTLTLLDSFVRDVQTSYVPGTLQFTRDDETAGLRVRWRPGGGRLEETLTYAFTLDHFEEAALSPADSIANTIDFRSSFKFLPKTALFIDYQQGFVHYTNSASGKSDSKPLHLYAGLTGLVTTKLTTQVVVGYAAGLYDFGASPSDLYLGAEVGWLIGPFARAKVGYLHDFANSLFGNFYDLDAAYANWNQQVGRYFMAGLTTRYEHRTYHCANVTGMPPGMIQCFQDVNGQNRVDNWLELAVDAHYFPTAWLSAGAQYQLLANVTDFQLMSMTGGIPARFVKHQVLGIISATY